MFYNLVVSNISDEMPHSATYIGPAIVEHLIA